jgi:hypothetical protein
MPNPNPDIEQMVEDAIAEQETSDRDRTRGKTMYTRKALVKIMRMKKSEFEIFAKGDLNGFEEAAVAHRKRTLLANGSGTQALALVRDTLGEQVSKQKEAPEKGSGLVDIVDDLPRAVRKPVN